MWHSAFCAATIAFALTACSGPSPRTHTPAYFESQLVPDEEPLDFDATAAPAPDASLSTSPEQPDGERLAREACASISRTASITAGEIPGGARLVLTPFDRSDLERLVRNINVVEYATDIEGCSLPGILRDAADVEVYVVNRSVRIDLTALRGQQTELRMRTASFAREVPSFGAPLPLPEKTLPKRK